MKINVLLVLFFLSSIICLAQGKQDIIQGSFININNNIIEDLYCRTEFIDITWTTDVEESLIISVHEIDNDIIMDQYLNVDPNLPFFSVSLIDLPTDKSTFYIKIQSSEDSFVRSISKQFSLSEKMVVINSITQSSFCKDEDIFLTIEAIGTNLQYTWFLNDNPISNDKGSLEIDVESLSDFDQYKVVVSDSCGDTYESEAITIEIAGEPEFELARDSAAFCEGEDIELQIFINGNDLNITKIDWLKDGKILDIDEDLEDETITISNVSLDMAGEYGIRLTNKCGEFFSKRINVAIEEKIEITKEFALDTINVGDTALFFVEYINNPYQVQWFKDGIRIDGEITDTLRIVNATEDDEGKYSIELLNPCGAVVSNLFPLEVISEGELPNMEVIGDLFNYEVLESTLEYPIEITVRNTGRGQFLFNIDSIVSQSSSQMVILPFDKTHSIGANESKIIEFDFIPIEPGIHTFSIYYSNNINQSGIITINAIVHVFEYELKNTPVDFGEVIINSQGVERFQITNKSEVTIELIDLEFDNAEIGDFNLINQLPLALSAGESEDIDLRFSPKKVRAYAATMYFKVKGTDYPIEVKILAEAKNVNSLNDNIPDWIEVFPNPAQDVINLIIPTSQISNFSQLELYSYNGELLQSLPVSSSMSVNVDDLVRGAYYLILKSENQVFHKKIIISK